MIEINNINKLYGNHLAVDNVSCNVKEGQLFGLLGPNGAGKTTMIRMMIYFLLLSIWILFAEVMVGIMLTGPNLIEERESRTMDALLCTPMSFAQIIISKCATILIFCVVAQFGVFVINNGFVKELLFLFFPMLLGAVLFIEIGAIIGLTIRSSKTGSAISSVVMILLFLVVSVYEILPKWTHTFFLTLPSVDMVEIMSAIINGTRIPIIPTVLLFLWLVVLSSVIYIIGRKRY